MFFYEREIVWSLFYAVRYCLFLTDIYFVSNGSSFLSIQNETGSSPILSCFGVLHPKKDCLPTIKVKHIDNVASPWFLFASCETAATLEIKFLYSLSFMRFFIFFLCIQYLDFMKMILYYLCNFHIFFFLFVSENFHSYLIVVDIDLKLNLVNL